MDALHFAAFLGATGGLSLRTLLPWLARIWHGETKFDPAYLVNTVLGAGTAIATGTYIMPAMPAGSTPLNVFVVMFLAAYVGQSVWATIVKFLQAKKDSTTVTTVTVPAPGPGTTVATEVAIVSTPTETPSQVNRIGHAEAPKQP